LRKSRGWVGWVEVLYGVVGAAMLYVLIHHYRQPIAMFPQSAFGEGQLLYLVFLWWVVGFNFSRAIVSFDPSPLVTEGVIAFNAVVCTVLVLCLSQDAWALWLGVPVAIVAVLGCWGLTHTIYGGQRIRHAGLCIRFGPDATATSKKPTTGKQHP
jgi:hypothetical protein